MRLLLVEDDRKLASAVQRGLEDANFIVDQLGDASSALWALKEVRYDLIILDIMLPVMDGMQFLTRLRAGGWDTPVLVLSARDAVKDRVDGLQAGADDYLVKPFDFVELVARVRTILRRGPQRQPEVLRIADMEIDIPGHRVVRGGVPIDLSAKEFHLLSLLARRSGEVLSRTTITEQVWDINFDSDTNTVEVTVRRLRAKLDDPFPVKLIRTVRGVGYVIEQH